MDYKASGVDIDAGNEAVRRIRGLARSTFTPAVLSDIGSFGGLFRFEPGRFADPVLVASADGVGTKLKVAFMAHKHDTVGMDLVNHCVNDILVQGADAAVLPGLPRDRQAVTGGGRIDRRRDGRGVPRERLCAARRRDRRDAGVLPRRRIRPGGIHRRRRGSGAADYRARHRARRRADRRAVERPAHQRLFARAPNRVRAPGAVGGQPRRGAGGTVGDALLEPHRSYLPLVRPMLEGGPHQGDGPHHRWRHHRQPAARAAGLGRRQRATCRAGRCRRSSSG